MQEHSLIPSDVNAVAPEATVTEENAIKSSSPTPKEILEATERFITENPLLSVGIAAATGFLLVRLFR